MFLTEEKNSIAAPCDNEIRRRFPCCRPIITFDGRFAEISCQRSPSIGGAAPIETTSVSWNHSLSEVLGALLRQGLEVTHFDEYDYSPYNCFAELEQTGERQYRLKHLPGKLPMVYSVVARRK